MNKYNHLNPEERAVIMLMLDQQCSLRKIAKKIQRHASTISRELARQPVKPNAYDATRAGKQYQKNRMRCKRIKKLNSNVLCDMVERHLISYKWSPEQISANLKQCYPNDQPCKFHQKPFMLISMLNPRVSSKE